MEVSLNDIVRDTTMAILDDKHITDDNINDIVRKVIDDDEFQEMLITIINEYVADMNK